MGRSDLAESPDQAEAARAMCLNLLAVRDRTRGELAQRLRSRGVADEVVESTLDRLANAGLIDDAAFARTFVSARRRDRGLARAELVRQLGAKGVDRSVALDAVGHLDSAAEHETARRIVERKLPSMANLDDAVKTRRLIGLLARKGYSSSTSYAVLRAALGEQLEASVDGPGGHA